MQRQNSTGLGCKGLGIGVYGFGSRDRVLVFRVQCEGAGWPKLSVVFLRKSSILRAHTHPNCKYPNPPDNSRALVLGVGATKILLHPKP